MCTQREVVALQLISFCVHNLDYRVLVLVLGINYDPVYVVGEFISISDLNVSPSTSWS